MYKNTKSSVEMLVIAALFAAMAVIFSQFLTIRLWDIKIGFGFVPVVLAALYLGPIGAGVISALADFLVAILFPIGPYFPGFTVSALLTGIIYGLLLYKNQSRLRIALSVIITQFIISLLLNSYWISILYGTPYIALIPTRIGQAALMSAAQILLIPLLCRIRKSIR